MAKRSRTVSLEERVPQLKEMRRKKARSRLKVLLVVFFVLILLVVYYQSPVSKVDGLTISGNQIVTDEEVVAWSGFKDGSFFLLQKPSLMSSKLKKHQEIKSVTFKRGFPNQLSVEIVEYTKTAYLKKENQYYTVLANGYVLPNPELETPSGLPILENFESDKERTDLIEELEKLPDVVYNRISQIELTPSVRDPKHIVLYMNDGMQVVGSILNLAEKLKPYPEMMGQLPANQKGIFDIEVARFFTSYENYLKEMEKTSSDKKENGE